VATGQTRVIFLHLDPLLLEQFLQFVVRYQELVEGNSSEALEEFGHYFAPSLTFLPFPSISDEYMFMLAPLMIIASTKSTKA
jgi:hypothetical protein